MSSKVIIPTKELMLTKGIDYYTFLDTEDFTVKFSSDTNCVSYCDHHPMCKGSFQINILHNNGTFSWEVSHKQKVLIKRFAEINHFLGNLLVSDLSNIQSTPSIVDPDYTLSYGFYDCGTRSCGIHLPNCDQSYVYLTSNYSEWMKDLASKDPKFLDSKLNSLALPGAHDAGMFKIFNPGLILKNEEFLNRLYSHFKDPFKCEAINFSDITEYLERIVINLACTQKDNINTMLNLGIRYFDFRPGYCYGSLKSIPEFKDKLFHQHAFIPGYPYNDFLCDILKWLALHPVEIIVINLNFQGFEEPSMKPSMDDLMELVSVAQSKTNTLNIALGNRNDLNVTIRQLLDQNKRLIFLNQIGANSDTYEYEAYKYDSYDGNKDKYVTTNVENILTVFNQMHFYPPERQDYTVLQLQGTSTADAIACSTSILDAIGPFSSDSMSPLMSTKAAFDHSTYPWLINNVPEKFSSEILLVFLNDFVDNALVKHSIDIICKRIGSDKCLMEKYSNPEALRDLIHMYKQDQTGVQCMSLSTAKYGFSQKTINDYKNKMGSYYTDDNLMVIMQDPGLQKVSIEQVYSGEQKENKVLGSTEIGQFLYMDVGRWGGDYDTCDAWTRRRNFGLVCGSAAILCDYKNPNNSVGKYLGAIDKEVINHPDIQKMIPLLNKLSEREQLGPVTVMKALVCTDKNSEPTSSDEILIFLGDIHAPVMNVSKRTYLQDAEPIDMTYAWSCGRIKITTNEIRKNKEIMESIKKFFSHIKKPGSEPKITEIIALLEPIFKNSSKEIKTELLNKILRKSFESQQFTTLGTIKKNRWIEQKWKDEYTIEALKIILKILLKDQQLNEWDGNETIEGDDACCWFKHYHGDEESNGVDIFQHAGEDLCNFLKLLLNYQKLDLTKVKLIQLGDLYDFWLGLKRTFDTIDPEKMFSDPATQHFLEFWQKETLFNTSVSEAIELLVNKTDALNRKFVYGNHDSYRKMPQWPDKEKALDSFESAGIWAEHGHQSDEFNRDPNAIIGWASSVFGFYVPEARDWEGPLRKMEENLISGTLCRRLTCILRATEKCQHENKKQVYVMGHTHEPLLKKVHVVR